MAAMLTTVDNPFDPNKQFDEWFSFDEQKGYHSCSYLARVAQTTSEMSDADVNEAVDRAIIEICRFNPELYLKVG